MKAESNIEISPSKKVPKTSLIGAKSYQSFFDYLNYYILQDRNNKMFK